MQAARCQCQTQRYNVDRLGHVKIESLIATPADFIRYTSVIFEVLPAFGKAYRHSSATLAYFVNKYGLETLPHFGREAKRIGKEAFYFSEKGVCALEAKIQHCQPIRDAFGLSFFLELDEEFEAVTTASKYFDDICEVTGKNADEFLAAMRTFRRISDHRQKLMEACKEEASRPRHLW
ncbi:hypothetical protein HZB07_06650 [Candidatus Saganbacteria bacterium]|nr:hypothetical protein [Candidatus Saganbacteria bacterium]